MIGVFASQAKANICSIIYVSYLPGRPVIHTAPLLEFGLPGRNMIRTDPWKEKLKYFQFRG